MYRPRNVPADPAQIPAFLQQELILLANALSSPQPYVLISKSYKPPDRPIEGMHALADGVVWNPGSGPGTYRFNGSSWIFLG